MSCLELDIYKVDGKGVWPLFAPHHYLTGSYAGIHAFIAVTKDGTVVGFTSSMPFPHGSIHNGWRGHRTVVLPDFQGMGIGVRLNEWLANWHIRQGHRFYARTTHPRLGAARNANPRWRETSSSGKQQVFATSKSKFQAEGGKWHVDTNRIAFSHEYMGDPSQRPPA